MAQLDEVDKAAMDHAWAWFSMHAAQRLQVVSYFLVSFALVVAGYGTAMQASDQVVAAGIAMTGVVISGAFLLLESRNGELVRVAEPALAVLEDRLAAQADLPELAFVRMVENPQERYRRYSFVIRAVMWSGILVMVLAAAVAVLSNVEHSPSACARHAWRESNC